MEAPATPFVWTGEAMVPPPGFARRCDEAFVIGQRYTMVEVLERSGVSHRHFFVLVREAWMNLPEADAQRFLNADILRKHALIRAGYCDVTTTVCKFKTEAQRMAGALQAQAAHQDDYVIVTVSGKVVTSYRAKSMKMLSMDKATFQAAKDAVLSILSDMIGVDVGTLSRHSEAA